MAQFERETYVAKSVGIKHLALLIALLLVLVFLLSGRTFHAQAVVINEYMASNRSVLSDEDGDFPDWVELKNTGSAPVEMEGYWLSDDPTNPLKWQFPAVTIETGDFLLLFLSGKDRRNPAGPYLHTNFRLSAAGETLVLCTTDSRIVDSVETGEMLSNISRGRKPGQKDEWVYFLEPTPGGENSTAAYPEIPGGKEEDSPVYINEFMTSNRTSILDEDGDLSDWIEIYNSGDLPVNLEGYWLSDKEDNPFKWRFPPLQIDAGQFLILFASGKNRTDTTTTLHTNFSLNDRDDTLVFSTPEGLVIDGITIRNMHTDVSYGREHNEGEWLYYPLPTPGESNYTQGFEYLSGKELQQSHNLHINEVMALNLTTMADEDGDFPDWIELYNSGDKPVNLAGFGLSDKPGDPFRWEFPDIFIEPDSYLLVFASGKDRNSPDGPYLHTNFKVRAQGETVLLSHPLGQVIDRMPTGMLAPDMSVGRPPDDPEGRVFFVEATPLKENHTGPLSAYAPPPRFSQAGGFFVEALTLSLAPGIGAAGAEIRYTLDGREPSENSRLYTGPVPIEKTTIVRARAFVPGHLPSPAVNHTYFINENTSLPVLSVMMDPDDLWDQQSGIYVRGYNASPDFPYVGANFWMDWEKPIHFQFFEADGTPGLSLDAGIKVGGQYSRAMPQKTLNVFARNRYGSNVMEYPFFPDNPLTTFKALTLRTSGQDATLSRIRDTMMSSLLEDTGLDYQDYRMTVLFLNGEYWGIYDIRERINKYFIAYKHDVDPEKVDLLQANSRVRAGSNKEYLEMRQYIAGNDMRQEEHYEYIKTQMDVENFMDYWIAQIYFANTDSANIRFWKEQGDEGRWRWIIYDLDWGFFNVHHNTLAYVTNPAGTGIGRRLSTVILVNLLKNDEFEGEFISRMAYHLNHTFAKDRVLQRIDQAAAEIEEEMHRHVVRWPQGGSITAWKSQVQRLRNFADRRHAILLGHIQKQFNLSSQDMEIFDAWKS